MKRILPLFPLFLSLIVSTSLGGDEVDLQILSEIRQEVEQNSQIEQILSHLTDVHGPRLTGSENLLNASRWSMDQLREWGLENVALEPWGEFGRGWELEKLSLEMTEPYYTPLIGYAKAWTESTEGVISGIPVLFNPEEEEDFNEFKGKLKGKIVLFGDPRDVGLGFEPMAERYSEEQLEEIRTARVGREGHGDWRRRYRAQREWRKRVGEFLRKEEVAVVLEPGRGNAGTVFVGSGGSHEKNGELGLPAIVLSAEHFGLLHRTLSKELELTLRVELTSRVLEDDLQAYNVLGEIPGSDPAMSDEVVMLGGHLDSWHAGTGATDNAAGCAVMLEVVRILQALKLQPRRTIRIALWTGEEQGLLGSKGYVERHFQTDENGKFTDEHEKFSAYFNLDNGTGKIRGIYLQGNDSVRPIFGAYIAPLADLGVTTLTVRDTGGTDHLPFDAVNLPAFQFIQDPVSYDTRTHHSNMDVFEHASLSDLKQASIVIATFVYTTAMRDEKLPRKVRAVDSD